MVDAHLLGSLTHEHEALGVRDDLGSVEGLFEIIDEELLVPTEWFFLGSGDDLAGADTLFLDRG